MSSQPSGRLKHLMSTLNGLLLFSLLTVGVGLFIVASYPGLFIVTSYLPNRFIVTRIKRLLPCRKHRPTFDEKKCPEFVSATFTVNGRLGNRISSYINFVMMDWHLGIAFFIPAHLKEELGLVFENVTFPTSDQINHCRLVQIENFDQFLRNEVKMGNRISTRCQPDVLNFRKGKHFHPHACFADLRNEELIHSHLQFKEDLKKQAEEIIMEVERNFTRKEEKSSSKENKIQFIGVHVRRGDWENHFWRKNFTSVNESYFKDAMDYYRSKYSVPVFLFLSDDMRWCRQAFTQPDIYHVGGNSPALDLCILSQCNHSVTTYGTFGRWGAFLAQGEVVAPFWKKTCPYQVAHFPSLRIIPDPRFMFNCKNFTAQNGTKLLLV